MKKRIFAGFIALCVTIGGLIGVNYMTKKDLGLAYASGYRDGIRITPTIADQTGVSVDSAYQISFEEGAEMSLEAVEAGLSIEPTLAFEVVADGEDLLVRLMALPEKNSLLKLSLNQMTWVYQVQGAFDLVGSLPRHMSTGVPVNSGIELYFSHTGAEVEDYFSIEPEVEGRFESYGATIVFVPEALAPMTLYTVVLEQGLSLKGSDDQLSDKVVFSFETGDNEEGIRETPKGYFNYNRIINDYRSDQPLYVPMRYSINDDSSGTDKIQNTLYSFAGADPMIEALRAYLDQPTWRNYSPSDFLTETDQLNKVIEFEQVIETINGYEMTVDLPVSLEPGFYLLQSEWSDIAFQTFIQVTDLGYFWFEDDLNDYYWLNDLMEDQPSAEAYEVNRPEFKADNQGLLTLPKTDGEGLDVRLLTDGENEVLHYVFDEGIYNPIYGYGNSKEDYWSYLQTDRSLYQPKDQVDIFGFLQNRDDGTFPESITLEIDEQRWYFRSFWPGTEDLVPLVSQTVKVDNGFFTGSLTLPNLDQGGYQIQVVSGEEVIGTQYIQVENYVKPDYKMTVTADKEAIFYDETVTYQVATSFFEGTPVSNVQVSYDVYGLSNDQGQLTSDGEGKASVSYTPGYQSDRDIESWAGFNAYATMPESGEIYGSKSTRVFLSDLAIEVTSKASHGQGEIGVQVNTIVLDRLNDGTAKDPRDYLEDPVQGQVLQGTVFRHEWVKREAGDYYDVINKITKKQYTYEMEKTAFEEVSLMTDEAGQGKVTLRLPEEKNVFYTVELSTKDRDNHIIKKASYFGNNDRYNYPDEDYLALALDKESYHVGEPVQVTISRGGQPAIGEKFLYVFASRGVKELYWRDEANLSTTFQQDFIPNIEVSAVVFNGDNYERVYGLNARVDQEAYEIDLSLEVDQANYQPGDEVVVNIKALDNQGNPIQDGVVNLSVVDEALFALRNQTIDTLAQLYGSVSSGVSGFEGSHNNSQRDYRLYYEGGMAADGLMMKGESTLEMVEETMALDGATSDAVIRSDFKDTALFLTTNLDDQGKGQVTFILPDNVTAWRLSGACISPSLEGGSQIEEVQVSLPFFINTTMNRTYLVGDQPSIGLAGYGHALSGLETINYTVTCEAADYSATTTGRPYEKVTLPLFEMEEGSYKIQVIASTGDLSDGYEETIQVVKTYQEKRVAASYIAEPGLTMVTSDSGMTTLTFSDQSKGKYLPSLYQLLYAGGKRVDQRYISSLAANLLNEKFDLNRVTDDVSIGDYMTEDGGIALLPYGEASLSVTAKLAAYVEEANQGLRLKNYLYESYYRGALDQRSLALYGLAKMGEPVLLDLNQRQEVDNLRDEDWLWLALAYAALGDDYMAEVIYTDHLAQDMELFEGRARYIGVSGEEAQYAMTAQLLPLLGMVAPEIGENALNYLRTRTSESYLVNLDLWAYVDNQLKKAKEEEPSLSYTYDDKSYDLDFEGWFGRSITIPSEKMSTFMVDEVTSDVMIIADYNGIGSPDQEVDHAIQVSRKYLDYASGEEKGNFKPGDIVKVVIDWEIRDSAIDHGYRITDYAPSGLVPMKHTWSLGIDDGNYWYRQIDGQKVDFGVYKDPVKYQPMVYYARVVSVGSFKADQAMIQGNSVLDSYNLSDSDVVVIEP